MKKMQNLPNTIFKLSCYKDGVLKCEYKFLKSKLMIGRSESSDIHLDNLTISHHHAFISVSDDSVKIIDLDSNNGTYVNDQKINNTNAYLGDRIRFGDQEFFIEETFLSANHEETLKDVDQRLKIISTDHQQKIPTELPPIPGLVLIDGEYCDIKFDESIYHANYTNDSFNQIDNIKDHFIDTEEDGPFIPKIFHQSDKKSIEVQILSMGNIISLNHLSLKRKKYAISSGPETSKSLSLSTLTDRNQRNFIQIDKGAINITPLPEHECYNISNGKKIDCSTGGAIPLKEDDTISFYSGTIQVIIKLVNSPPDVNFTPFFGRDREYHLHNLKVCSSLISLMLLLLFVDISTPPPEKKKIAIIYRKAIKAPVPSKVRSSTNPTKVNKDLGVKKTKQPKKPIQMAKKSAPQKSKPTPQKKKTTKVSSVAPKVKKASPVKSYKLKLSKSLTSFVSSSNSKVKVVKNSRSTSSINDYSSSSSKSLDQIKKSNGASGARSIGSDYSGNFSNSTGAQGLSSKSGIDTTYIDPKTVVLGSMDPELLRKILKEYLPQFRHCYQQELNRNDSLQGVLDLNFRIEKNGKVSKVKIKTKSAAFSKRGVGCMAKVLRIIPFPKPKGGGLVDVRQPLNFLSEKHKL